MSEDSRRERYAAAIQRAVTGGHSLTSILPEVYEATDAAMAVADTENKRAVDAVGSLGEALADAKGEIALLRAALKAATGMTPEDWREMRKHGAHCDNILTDAELDARETA